MKKYIVIALLIAAGLFFFLNIDSPAEKQNALMEDAVAAVETFNEGGDAGETVSTLSSLAEELAKLNAKGDLAKGADPEITKKADQLRAQLAEASLQLELSEHAKAPEVSAALDKFIGQ